MNLFHRFANLFSRSKIEREIHDELHFHIDMRIRDGLAAGLSPAKARRDALRKFGNPTVTQEKVSHADLALGLDALFRDLRYAWRMLWRNKGFTAVAVGSLALGIGANTIIFSLAKSVLLDRLAVSKPEQLRAIALIEDKKSTSHNSWGGQVPTRDGQMASASFSYPIYQQVLEQNRADTSSPLQDPFGFQYTSNPTITVDGHADVVNGTIMVSGNFYQQMQVQPVLGRGIAPADDTPGNNVAVISDRMWSRLFGRAPGVIGKVVQLNLISFTIVGVNPPAFTGPATTQISPDIFVPLAAQPVLSPLQMAGQSPSMLNSNTEWWVQMVARLKPGASDVAAETAMQAWIDRDIRATMPVTNDAVMPKVVLADSSRGMMSRVRMAGFAFDQSLYVLAGLAGFVLLLACANLANLLLARSSARQREMSVRLALGASRGRVLRQVLTENLLLSTLGGALGFALGYVGRNAIPQLMSLAWRPPTMTVRFDGGILLFAIAISLVTGALFGIVPAWQATRADVHGSLKESSLTTTRRRRGFTGRSIVAFQVALSMVLVVGAGLFARTLMNLNSAPLGFDPEHLTLFDLQAPYSRYPAPQDVLLLERVEDRLARIPGVQGVTAVWITPVSFGQVTNGFQPMDMPRGSGIADGMYYNNVGQSFFDVYRIPLLAGRGFDASDSASSMPVAVINQAAAKKIYHGQNPIGRSFKIGQGGEKDQVYQIIGVSGDAKYTDLASAAPPTVYTFYRQSKSLEGMTYVLKSAMPANDLLPQMRAAVAEIDKDLPLRGVRTQTAQIAQTASQQTLLATLTTAFAVLALVLACIGIYGLMAYDVARRTSEIGIRMALGAKAGQMLGMVLREAWWTAAAGVVVGLSASLWLTRFVKSMLFGLAANDVWTLCGASALLLGIAVLSAFGPARRAAHVEPMIALRHE